MISAKIVVTKFFDITITKNFVMATRTSARKSRPSSIGNGARLARGIAAGASAKTLRPSAWRKGELRRGRSGRKECRIGRRRPLVRCTVCFGRSGSGVTSNDRALRRRNKNRIAAGGMRGGEKKRRRLAAPVLSVCSRRVLFGWFFPQNPLENRGKRDVSKPLKKFFFAHRRSPKAARPRTCRRL